MLLLHAQAAADGTTTIHDLLPQLLQDALLQAAEGFGAERASSSSDDDSLDDWDDVFQAVRSQCKAASAAAGDAQASADAAAAAQQA